MNGNIWATILPLVILIAVMYFLLIRPQKKREKEVNAMRSGVQVGERYISVSDRIAEQSNPATFLSMATFCS